MTAVMVRKTYSGEKRLFDDVYVRDQIKRAHSLGPIAPTQKEKKK